VIECEMIAWSGKEHGALECARKLMTGAVAETAPVCAAGLGQARRRAEFSKNNYIGNYAYNWIHVKRQSRVFSRAALLAAGQLAVSGFMAMGSGSRQNGEMGGKKPRPPSAQRQPRSERAESKTP
jgi:hypothetical protein